MGAAGWLGMVVAAVLCTAPMEAYIPQTDRPWPTSRGRYAPRSPGRLGHPAGTAAERAHELPRMRGEIPRRYYEAHHGRPPQPPVQQEVQEVQEVQEESSGVASPLNPSPPSSAFPPAPRSPPAPQPDAPSHLGFLPSRAWRRSLPEEGANAEAVNAWENALGTAYKRSVFLPRAQRLHPSLVQQPHALLRRTYHLLVAPKRKFAFCGIEKVGITLWTQIFCRINYGVKETVHPVTGAVLRSCALNFTQNWQSHSRGYMSREYHWTNSLHRDVIFGNPEWFVATVVRDPLERLLSGYLDKCVTRKKREFERHCEPRAFSDGKPDEYFKTKEAFATFVSLLPQNPNVHFWPQTEYCLLKNLGRELPFYRFVGVMNATYAEQVSSMAQAAGWADVKIDDILKAGINRGKYRGQGSTSTSWLTQYYTVATAKRALDHYADDYVHLNLPLPAFLYELGSPSAHSESSSVQSSSINASISAL